MVGRNEGVLLFSLARASLSLGEKMAVSPVTMLACYILSN